MRVAVLGFLIGIVLLQQLAVLPGLAWSFCLPVLLLLGYRLPRWRFMLCLALGFFWASTLAHVGLKNGLDAELEGQDLVVEGYVSSLPENRNRGVQFQFDPVSVTWHGVPQSVPGKILLSWYDLPTPIRVGECWRLQVRLKRPHGFMNPGSFDYEGWLFQQGIRAKGYVRPAPGINQLLESASYRYPVNQLRQGLRDRLDSVLQDHDMQGLINALALGDRQRITLAQWEVLTRTGTSHLVAISGLHVGLVAGFAFFIGSRAWRLSSRAVSLWPAARAGALFAIVAAGCYAMLAGFSVPTQRALVMVTVVMLAIILQRRTRPGNLLAIALWAVLVLDPMAVLSPGFWLSFAAVAVILYGMVGRIGGEVSWRKWWWQWGRVQWLITIGLFPLLVLLFQKASLVSLLANLVAVPWVSLVSVPLVLLGVVVLAVLPSMADQLLALAAASLDGLWWWLQILGGWTHAQWYQAMPGAWVLAAAIAGAAWLLAPRGIPGRWVGAVLLLPVFFAGTEHPVAGEAGFTLLDVGQGLAAVVRTENHALVFDTGPQFSSGFNAGQAVVAPYLRAKGIERIDTLVVSHGDNDHAGGAEELAAEITVDRIISSVAKELAPLQATDCLAGETWQWDGVVFEILNPAPGQPTGKGRKANNRSCVLRVQAKGDSVLLTGDIEKGAERQLVTRLQDKLASTVLVVPHHGSKTSSSPAFIDTVAPDIALFPVGYRNRYGFPRETVVQRYQSGRVTMLDSAQHGAIEISLGGPKPPLETIRTWRQQGARYWHHQSHGG